MKRSLTSLRSLLLMALVCISLMSCLLWGVAEARPYVSTVRYTAPPPNLGAPTGRPQGGGTRGPCPETPVPLTALAPSIKQTSVRRTGRTRTSVYMWGLTTVAYPSFWFYVPYTSEAAYPTDFVLQDENDRDVYRTSVSLPKQAGVISVSLPATAKALEVGKSYHWYLRVFCPPQPEPPLPDVKEGEIRRVSLDPALKKQIEAAEPQQRVALYAAKGLWYDALSTSATLRAVKPEGETLKADWISLLRSVGLETIAMEPLTK